MDSSREYAERRKRLQAQLAQSGVDLIAIAPTPNMTYLLGFAPKYDERICLLLVTPQDARLVVPHLNAGQVESHTGLTAIRWTDEQGPAHAVTQALDELGLEPNRVLAADDTMHASDLIELQNLAHPAQTLAGGAIMSRLRMLKSASEIEKLARAAAQADRALMAGVRACKVGATERDVADAISGYFINDGAQQVNFTIIASGPNGAFPHHHSGLRKLQNGDTIIIDIGATLDGYMSDVTRVVSLGKPTAEVQRAYDVVRQGNERGHAAVRPGALAREVDFATRAPIDGAGFGEYFFHRTGHGLGIEEHEPPWISSVSETVLEPGMVFSVEPGVYLEGKFGIRIEDIAVVTPEGSRNLTGLSHDLIVVD